MGRARPTQAQQFWFARATGLVATAAAPQRPRDDPAPRRRAYPRHALDAFIEGFRRTYPHCERHAIWGSSCHGTRPRGDAKRRTLSLCELMMPGSGRLWPFASADTARSIQDDPYGSCCSPEHGDCGSLTQSIQIVGPRLHHSSSFF